MSPSSSPQEEKAKIRGVLRRGNFLIGAYLNEVAPKPSFGYCRPDFEFFGLPTALTRSQRRSEAFTQLSFAPSPLQDYFTKLLVCRNRIPYIKELLNIVDLISILPFYVELIITSAGALEAVEALKALSSLCLVTDRRCILPETTVELSHVLMSVGFYCVHERVLEAESVDLNSRQHKHVEHEHRPHHSARSGLPSLQARRQDRAP